MKLIQFELSQKNQTTRSSNQSARMIVEPLASQTRLHTLILFHLYLLASSENGPSCSELGNEASAGK